MGYGRTGVLEHLSMSTISYEVCQNLEHGQSLPEDKFCLRNDNVLSTLCEGDSGGGFAVNVGGTFYLFGVISYSPKLNIDCVSGEFVVLSNVHYMRRDLHQKFDEQLNEDMTLF